MAMAMEKKGNGEKGKSGIAAMMAMTMEMVRSEMTLAMENCVE